MMDRRPSREATQEFFSSHLVNRGNEALTPQDWADLADSFAEDASYLDSTYGMHRGRPAIRKFLHDSIVGLGEWRFPIQWTEIGEGRVVVQLLNRAPGTRRDGSYYEFPSVTIVEYDLSGKITSQMDMYDRLWAIKVFAQSTLGAFMRRAGRLVGRR